VSDLNPGVIEGSADDLQRLGAVGCPGEDRPDLGLSLDLGRVLQTGASVSWGRPGSLWAGPSGVSGRIDDANVRSAGAAANRENMNVRRTAQGSAGEGVVADRYSR
jgi:hypothetical protein